MSSAPYRGLLLHDDRFSAATYLAASSTVTQAGPRPGRPTKSGDTDLVLGTGGTSDGTTYNWAAIAAGYAETGGCTFRWKESTVGATSWRGFLPHGVVTGWELVNYTAAGAGTTPQPAVLRLPDDTLVCVYRSSTTALTCQTRSPIGNAWGAGVAVATISAATAPHPALVWLPPGASYPDGRILCIYYVADTATTQGLAIAYSDDAGVTWTEAVNPVGGFSITVGGNTFRRLSAVCSQGVITLVTSFDDGANYEIDHYTSDDYGATWARVEQFGSVVAANVEGGVVVADHAGTVYLAYHVVSSTLRITKKGGPGSRFGDSVAYGTVLASAETTTAVIAACIASDDTLWVAATLDADNESVWLYRVDTDLTALVSGNEPICADDFDFDFLAIEAHQEKLLLFGSGKTGAAVSLNSVWCAHLGGYSSVTWNTSHTWGRSTTAARAGYWWQATATPNTPWTANGAGTDTILSSGYDEIVTIAGQTRNWDRSGTQTAEMLVWARLKMVAGGSLFNADCGMRVRRDNGANRYQAEVRFSTTQIRLADVVSAATITTFTPASGDLTTDFDLLVCIDSTTKLSAWFKRPNEQLWQEVTKNTALTAGGSVGNDQVIWGHIAAAATTSRWRFVGSSLDDVTTDPDLSLFTNPGGLQGRELSVWPLWLDGGTTIRSEGGVAVKGDAYTLAPSYDYPIEAINPETEPSPSRGWRSTSEAEHIIVWRPNAGILTRFECATIGVGLFGINFETAYFEGYTGAAWDTLVQLNAGTDNTKDLRYLRQGDMLRPDTAAGDTGSRWYSRDEFAGGTIALGNPATVFRRIGRHSEGLWQQASTRYVHLHYDGAVVADPATQRASIWSPNVVGYVHGMTTAYTLFRLRIVAQTTANGYFEIGTVVIGPIVVFGTQYSWGRMLETEANVSITESRSGRRRTRLWGPPRSAVEFSWTDALDTRAHFLATPAPTTVMGATEAIGTVGDGWVLEGILRRQDGPHVPVVYLPTIADAAGNTPLVRRGPEECMYGRLVTKSRREMVIGDERDDEAWRIQTVRIEQEV